MAPEYKSRTITSRSINLLLSPPSQNDGLCPLPPVCLAALAVHRLLVELPVGGSHPPLSASSHLGCDLLEGDLQTFMARPWLPAAPAEGGAGSSGPSVPDHLEEVHEEDQAGPARSIPKCEGSGASAELQDLLVLLDDASGAGKLAPALHVSQASLAARRSEAMDLDPGGRRNSQPSNSGEQGASGGAGGFHLDIQKVQLSLRPEQAALVPRLIALLRPLVPHHPNQQADQPNPAGGLPPPAASPTTAVNGVGVIDRILSLLEPELCLSASIASLSLCCGAEGGDGDVVELQLREVNTDLSSSTVCPATSSAAAGPAGPTTAVVAGAGASAASVSVSVAWRSLTLVHCCLPVPDGNGWSRCWEDQPEQLITEDPPVSTHLAGSGCLLPSWALSPSCRERLDPLALPAVWAALARPSRPFSSQTVHEASTSFPATAVGSLPGTQPAAAAVAESPFAPFDTSPPVMQAATPPSGSLAGWGGADRAGIPIPRGSPGPSPWLSQSTLAAASAATAGADHPIIFPGGPSLRAYDRPRSMARRSFRSSSGHQGGGFVGGRSPPTLNLGSTTLYSNYRATDSSGGAGALGFQVRSLLYGQRRENMRPWNADS